MSGNIRESKTIQAAADTVWAVVGHVARVSVWVPAIESSSLEGDVRTAGFAGGGEARERIVERDDDGRTYVYEYLEGPLALTRYRSRLRVDPKADGTSEVVWDAEFAAGTPEQEAALRDAIAGIYAGALEELDRMLGREVD